MDGCSCSTGWTWLIKSEGGAFHYCFALLAYFLSLQQEPNHRKRAEHLSFQVFTVPYARSYIYLEAHREADVRRWLDLSSDQTNYEIYDCPPGLSRKTHDDTWWHMTTSKKPLQPGSRRASMASLSSPGSHWFPSIRWRVFFLQRCPTHRRSTSLSQAWMPCSNGSC